MAEVMLLLVFCLLLALAVLFSKQREELATAQVNAAALRQELAQANLARASADHFARMLERILNCARR